MLSEISTRQSNGRPCGVGLVLVGNSKELGCQIFQSCPSGDVSQMRCTSIGMFLVLYFVHV